MKTRKWFLFICCLVTLGLAILPTGCERRSENSETRPSAKATPVRIGCVPYSSSLPAFVAQEEGLFRKEGLTVELVRFETSNEAIIALTKGDVDGVMGIGLTSLLAIELKTPGLFKMVWHAVESSNASVNAIIVPVKSDLKDIGGLRGKVVGTFAGATQLLNLQAILKGALGDVNAARITQVSPNLQLQVLEKGEIDALFTIEPQVSLALERGIGRVLVDNPRCLYILNPFPAGGGVLSTRFLKGRPEEARKVVRALDEAIQRIRTNEGAAKAILPKHTPMEAALAGRSRLYGWWTSGEVDMKALQQVIDLFVRDGVISASVNAKSIALPPP